MMYLIVVMGTSFCAVTNFIFIYKLQIRKKRFKDSQLPNPIFQRLSKGLKLQNEIQDLSKTMSILYLH